MEFRKRPERGDQYLLYCEALDLLIEELQRDPPPFLLLPGRSARLTGQDLLKRAGRLGVTLPHIGHFPYSIHKPPPDLNLANDDYDSWYHRELATSLQILAAHFDTQTAYIFDDYAEWWTKLATIAGVLRTNRILKPRIYVLAAKTPNNDGCINLITMNPQLVEFLKGRVGKH